MVDRYSIFKSESQNYHPSFSSTLLDAVYRSIDLGEEQMAIYREPTKKKQNYYSDSLSKVFTNEEEMANFQRACMIEKWMEKKVTEKVVVRRKSVPDLQTKKSRKHRQNSSSSSSDSSLGGFFSSSEAESFPVQRPKPVRTGGCGFEKQRLGKILRDFETSRCTFADQLEPKPKNEGGFLKTKSRALKIYGDLKKVKQPISPGGKLAGFLNSIFTSGNTKKPKNGEDSKSANTSTCSSASSFSRSCLSKTPSSGGKTYSGVKRSVKFFPVSVIVDEDCQPCGHKSLHGQDKNIKKQSSHFDSVKNNNVNDDLMGKNRRVEEVAREFLQKYQKKNQVECEVEYPCDNIRNSSDEKNQMFVRGFEDEDDDEDDDDDDAASYASSDLFELDNLSAIGMERYREELPVYETTHLDTNRAIANGFNL